MPVFALVEEPVFPPAGWADKNGLLAIGGDLSPQRITNAYRGGIFPWFAQGDPILWWSPDPRLVIFPGEMHVSRTMDSIFEKNVFQPTYDRDFVKVLENCRKPRKKQPDTWITPEMSAAYIELHRLGYAHSLEVWSGAELVGGLYGLSFGKAFFGESMFSSLPNASKYALIALARELFNRGFLFIDCQVPSPHLKTLGAREIPRSRFLKLLQKALTHPTQAGKWGIFPFQS